MVEMTSLIDPNKISVLNPTMDEREEIDRQIAAGDLPRNYWDLRKEATARFVFGHDAKKDSKGNFVEQGLGAPGNESANHFQALRKAEQMGLEPPGAYDKAVAACWKRTPDLARKLGLPGGK